MTTVHPSPDVPLQGKNPGLRGSRGWLPWVAGAVFALGLAMAALRVGLGFVPGTGSLGADWVMTDFYSSMYYPVRAVLDGGNPHDASWLEQYPGRDRYGPFLPVNLVIHLPFALLTPETAGQVYFAFSILMALLLAALSLRLAGVTVTASLAVLVAGLVLLSRPGHWTLMLGQHAILLACLSYVALLNARSAPLLSGLALSLAAYKPNFGVPLALIMLVGGHVRAVTTGAAIGLAVNLPLYWILASRAGGFRRFFETMIGSYQKWQARFNQDPSTNYGLVDVDGLISRFMGQSLDSGARILLAIGIPIVAGLVIRRLDWDRQTGRDLAVAIACTALLLSTHHLGYDMVILTAPVVALVARGLPPGAPSGLRWVFLALYVIPALNWAATRGVLHNWGGSRAAWLAITSINGLCLAALFFGYVWLALAHGRRPSPTTSASPSAQPA